ncbi:MAG TPA: ABC transporter permease [Iamia sp.]|nr:ABC transporter permease [Iamia sp.]
MSTTRPGLRRIAAIARHDLRLLRTDPGFLVVFTVSPLAFMAFSTKASGAALRIYLPGSDVGGAAFIVPGAAVVFSGFLVGNVGFGVFREHGWRTWERLRASPLSSAELMAGKSLVPLLCIAFQLTALLGGGALLFGLEMRGSWAAFLLVAVALGVMNLALGFMLLALCRSSMQLNAIASGGAMLVGGLAGAVTPVETLPGWAQAVAPVTPAYWAMRGFRAVTIDGGGLADVALPLAVLAGFTVVFATIALRRFDVEDAKIAWA